RYQHYVSPDFQGFFYGFGPLENQRARRAKRSSDSLNRIMGRRAAVQTRFLATNLARPDFPALVSGGRVSALGHTGSVCWGPGDGLPLTWSAGPGNGTGALATPRQAR
ncbi:MAG: hypothetical protein ACLFV1_03015, partial [Thiohalophilus sp.]